MRCAQECSLNLQIVPKLSPCFKLEDQIPFCDKCGAAMRPHIKLMNENLALNNEVNELIYSEVDVVIIIGSALTSLLSRKIVNKLSKRKVMTINIDTDIRRNICNPIKITTQPYPSSISTLSNCISEFFNSAVSSDTPLKS